MVTLPMMKETMGTKTVMMANGLVVEAVGKLEAGHQILARPGEVEDDVDRHPNQVMEMVQVRSRSRMTVILRVLLVNLREGMRQYLMDK